jgi:predicted TIM-barrel fold metal-dependent hydrolase
MPNTATNALIDLPRCDCHFHVFYKGEDIARARYVPPYASTLAQWQNAALSESVTRGVVVQPSFLGTDNSQLLAAIGCAPDDLRGVAVVPETISLDALTDLHRQGVRGLRLNCAGNPHAQNQLRAISRQWWRDLQAANLHVELHADIGQYAKLIPTIPSEIALVLDHFAKPASASANDETVLAVRARQRGGAETFVTLSGAYRLGETSAYAQREKSAALAALWAGELGIGQLLWASDWPCTNHEAQADYSALLGNADLWRVDHAAHVAVMQKNPARLYWR